MSITDYLIKLILLCSCLGTIPFATPLQALQESSENSTHTVYVEVAETKLRADAKPWGIGKADLSYGTQLDVISNNGSWLKVKTAAGIEGYVHQTAVTNRKVVLSSTIAQGRLRPDESDVVLAGKGFSRELEKGLSETQKELNYSDVEKIEKYSTTARELQNFIIQGKLNDLSKASS